MRKVIQTILLLIMITAAKAAEPTLPDARADFDAARYSAARAKISRILSGSAARPGDRRRYDLFMLRGECQLQNKSSPQAAPAFAAALEEVDFAAEPKKAAEARAMKILTKVSPRLMYQSSKDTSPIDIVAADSRKKALAALLEQRFVEAQPQMRAAVSSSSLLPTKSLLPTLADLYAIEMTLTGDVVRTCAAIRSFDEHARQLLDAELQRIQARVGDLQDLANEAVLSEGPRPQLSYRGLTSPQRDELRSLANTLIEIEQVIRDGEGINKSIGSHAETWKALMARCSSIELTAERAYKRSF